MPVNPVTETITLAALVDALARQLDDTEHAVYPHADLEAWILEAIRDYSNHFPRVLYEAITATTAVHKYNLPTQLREIVDVECPAGETTPHMLHHMDVNDPLFYDTDDHWDAAYTYDPDTYGFIYVSPELVSGDIIFFTYYAYHWATVVGVKTAYIIEQHQPLIYLYGSWRAATHRLNRLLTSVPASDPSLINAATAAATAARTAYDNAIAQAKSQVSTSETADWKMDTYDRIY